MGLLSLLRDILFYGFKLFKIVGTAITNKKVDDAFEASDEDQRPVEEIISNSAGRASKYEYDGMRTRKSKKRD